VLHHVAPPPVEDMTFAPAPGETSVLTGNSLEGVTVFAGETVTTEGTNKQVDQKAQHKSIKKSKAIRKLFVWQLLFAHIMMNNKNTYHQQYFSCAKGALEKVDL